MNAAAAPRTAKVQSSRKTLSRRSSYRVTAWAPSAPGRGPSLALDLHGWLVPVSLGGAAREPKLRTPAAGVLSLLAGTSDDRLLGQARPDRAIQEGPLHQA